MGCSDGTCGPRRPTLGEVVEDDVFGRSGWIPLEAAAQPPYWRPESCPLHDIAGAAYSYEKVCKWPYVYTGQIIVKGPDSVLAIGSGIRISQEHVLTAANILKYASDPGVEVRFVAPGSGGFRVGVDRKIVRWKQPNRSAVFGACSDVARLTSEDSSDIALCWLERLPSEAMVDEETLVLPGATPTARVVREAMLSRQPIEALVVSSWLVDERGAAAPSLHAMLGYIAAVPVSGSVVVLNVPHPQGTYPVGPFGGARDLPYTALYEAGSPVVIVGPGIEPVLIGIVSCVLDDPGKGVIYRVTRVDRWAGWLRGLVEPEVPVPPVTPPPPVPGPPVPPGPDGQSPPESLRPVTGGSGGGGVSGAWIVAGVLSAVALVGGWALGRGR